MCIPNFYILVCQNKCRSSGFHIKSNNRTQRFGKTGSAIRKGSFLRSVRTRETTCLLGQTLKCFFFFFFFFVEQTLHWLTNLCHLIEKFISQPCLRLFLAYAGLHLKWSMKICHLYSNGCSFIIVANKVMFFTRVYLLAGWWVCQQDDTKTLEQISTKLGWRMAPCPEYTPISFGAVPDKGMDPGNFFFYSARYCSAVFMVFS